MWICFSLKLGWLGFFFLICFFLCFAVIFYLLNFYCPWKKTLVKGAFLSDHPEATVSHTHTTPDFHCWDQSPFTADGSSDPLGAPFGSLHTPHSESDRVSLLAQPRVSRSSLRCLDPLSNLIVVKWHKNSLTWCLWGGTPNKSIPGLLYSTVCAPSQSGVFLLSHQLLL